MKILLDTLVFLWILDGGHQMTANAREVYFNLENQLFLSAASYWEICIKQSIGKLVLSPNWQKVIGQQLLANHIRWLPIEITHCNQLMTLPFHHNDPFDRLLIAQANHEGMHLLTHDINIQQYNVPVIW